MFIANIELKTMQTKSMIENFENLIEVHFKSMDLDQRIALAKRCQIPVKETPTKREVEFSEKEAAFNKTFYKNHRKRLAKKNSKKN